MPGEGPLLCVKQVSKTYAAQDGSAVQALRAIDLDVSSG